MQSLLVIRLIPCHVINHLLPLPNNNLVFGFLWCSDVFIFSVCYNPLLSVVNFVEYFSFSPYSFFCNSKIRRGSTLNSREYECYLSSR